jgi:hypothetical protein
MKTKIIGYLSELITMGVGAVIAKIVDAWAWLGFTLIGIGIIGIIVTSFWEKIPVTIKLGSKQVQAERKNKAKGTLLTDKYGWLERLVTDQWHNLQNYLYHYGYQNITRGEFLLKNSWRIFCITIK